MSGILPSLKHYYTAWNARFLQFFLKTGSLCCGCQSLAVYSQNCLLRWKLLEACCHPTHNKTSDKGNRSRSKLFSLYRTKQAEESKCLYNGPVVGCDVFCVHCKKTKSCRTHRSVVWINAMSLSTDETISSFNSRMYFTSSISIMHTWGTVT
jgi:hypothetical protein